MQGIFFSLFSALLLILTLPYINWWWLVFVALVPYFLALRRASTLRSALSLTMLFGVSYGFAAAWPLLNVTAIWWTGGISMLQNAVLVWTVILSMTLCGVLFFLPIAYAERRTRTSGIRDVFVVAILWAILEYLRSKYALMGYEWGTVGYALVDMPEVKHIASFASVYGLSFFAVATNMMLALIIDRARTLTPLGVKRSLWELIGLRGGKYGMAIFLSLWIGSVGFGLAREARTPQKFLSAPLHVATVVSDFDGAAIGGGTYRAYRRDLLLLLAAHPDTDIVLLPENVFPFFRVDEMTGMLAKRQFLFIDDQNSLYADFLSLTKRYALTTFAVGVHTERDGKGYNSLVFYRDGAMEYVQKKRRLLPFFEYAPLSLPIPIFEPLTPGNGSGILSLFGMPMGTLVCSEIDDGRMIPFGTRVILSPANDGVFASSAAARMHRAVARMRALESGAYIIRATKGGISVIIDPYGRILASQEGRASLWQTLH